MYFNLGGVPYAIDAGVIVDVGMNRGQFAGEALARFRPAGFLGIEMLPDLAALLRKNPIFHDPPTREVVCTAVGDRDGRTAFYRVPEWQDSSSLLILNPQSSDFYANPKLVQSEVAEGTGIRTLDSLCKERGIEAIALLKVDVQGYEGPVLWGGRHILTKTKAVIVEVLLCEHYYGQSSPEEIHALLTCRGLKFQHWLHFARGLQGDALYIRA